MNLSVALRLVLPALAWAIGCGGSAVIVGDGGGEASCSDDCSPAQIADSCASLCDKFARASCPGTATSPTCATQCANLPSMVPACKGALVAFLRCTGPVQPACTDAGSAFLGCEAQDQAVNDCVADAGAPGTVVTPPSDADVESPDSSFGSACTLATVCPTIPRPTTGMCFGGGGGGAGGPVTTQTTCEDGAGNVWQSSCVGSTCTCSYNGGSPCTCTTTAACASCCPGAS